MIYVYYSSCLLFLLASVSYAANRVILPDADRTYLIELLQETHPEMTADSAHELVYELENFYTGVRDNLWNDCGPPYKIDKAFHLHIINTRFYAAFCETNFGHFVHHSPFWSTHRPRSDLLERCGTQVQKLRDHGIDVKYEYLWAPPTCGSATDNQGNHNNEKTREDYHERWYCEL